MPSLLALVACWQAHPPGPSSPAGAWPVDPSSPVATGDTGGARGTGHTGTEPVPLLDEVLDCDVSSVSMAEGTDLHRIWLEGAVCNDGSPAAIYVRRAPDPTEDRWVLFFEGGGRCASAAACEDRWCGRDYDASKMSSRWFPAVRSPGGMLRGESEAFGGWNLVFFAYCSSDQWTGTRRDVVLEGKGASYRLHFDGATTVDRALETLLPGASSDDGTQTLPPLSDASKVVVAGLSAGGMGVVTHLDRIAADLPGATVLGVVDAMVTPDPAPLGDPGLVAAFEAESQRQWAEEHEPLYAARQDASCAAAAEPWRCIGPSFVQRGYLETPFFVVHDYRDGPLRAPFTALGVTDDGYAIMSEVELASLAAARPEVGVHGSTCGHHTRIGSNLWFTSQPVYDGVRPWSVEEALVAWVGGARVVVMDAADGGASRCP